MQGSAGKQAQAIDPQQQAAEARKRAMANFNPPAPPPPQAQGMPGVLQNAGMPPTPPGMQPGAPPPNMLGASPGQMEEMQKQGMERQQAMAGQAGVGGQLGQANALQNMLQKFGMPQNPTGEPMGGPPPSDAAFGLTGTPPSMASQLPPEMPMAGMGGIQQLGALTGAPGLQQPGPIGQMVASKKPMDPMAGAAEARKKAFSSFHPPAQAMSGDPMAGKMQAKQPMMKTVS